jgi:hypothetical protein
MLRCPGPASTHSRIRLLEKMHSPAHSNQESDACKVKFPQLINVVEPAEMARKQSVPGPGQYKSIGITSNGKYTVSTMP